MAGCELEDAEEILRMATILGEIGYRSLSNAANRQRAAVARRLWREGVNHRLLSLLWQYAQECGHTPVKLFCYWMDHPPTAVRKCNEMRRHSEWLERLLQAEMDKAKLDKTQRALADVISLAERRRQA